MEMRSATKRRYFAYGVNESLLELAMKLKEAEVRVNGQSLQTAIPPRNVLSGISSTLDGGRFQFTARKNHTVDNFPTAKYINSNNAVVTTSSVDMVSSNGFCANVTLNSAEGHIVDMPVNTQPKKLSLPKRNGPSLWPFLSSIKTSSDTEHVRFLEKNQQFYSVYKKSRVIAGYTEDLLESDFEIVIDSAIDTLLQTHEPPVLQQPAATKIEFCAPAAVSPVTLPVPVPVPLPLPVNTDIDVQSALETDDTSAVLPQPVVSKRYAAAIANPRRFRCELCPYSTNNRSHVRRHHLSVHSDARPYRCYVCGKEFARCENAKVHMVSRHPDVPYSVDRLRSSMFVEPTINLLSNPTTKNLTPSTSASSSSTSSTSTTVQLQQDVGRCGVSSQWPSESLGAELGRAQLECHQNTSAWLNFPKIEPKPDPSLPVLSQGSTSNNLLGSAPQSVFPAQTNAVLNVRPLFGPLCPPHQESSSVADIKPVIYPVADHHVCLYCQFVCQSAAELAAHIATNHTTLGPTLHAAPISNPGYVVLQTAAPIFLFPPPNPVLPNRSQVDLGYPPILPKLPNEVPKVQNDASTDQKAKGIIYRSPYDVPDKKVASVHWSSSSTPAKVQESHFSATTPASSEGKRERRRQFKTFYCNYCPDRPPFRYEKSYEKHMLQHRHEDRSATPQKIASKVV